MTVGIRVGTGVRVGATVGVGVGLAAGLRVGLRVGVGDGEGIGVTVGVDVGVRMGVGGVVKVHPAMQTASVARSSPYLREDIVFPNCALLVRPVKLAGAGNVEQIYHRAISRRSALGKPLSREEVEAAVLECGCIERVEAAA